MNNVPEATILVVKMGGGYLNAVLPDGEEAIFGRRIVIPSAEMEKLLTMKQVDGPAKRQRRAHVSTSAPVEV